MELREFRSKVEDLIKAKELKLPSTAGFKPFCLFFSEESVSHPAKANLHLLYFLIKKYTEEGDVVADIMAGSGSTGVVASYLGRHSVLIELEEKFYRWIVGWHPCHGWECTECRNRETKKRDLEEKINLLGVKWLDEEGLLTLLFYREQFSSLHKLEKEMNAYPWHFPKPSVDHDVSGNVDLLEKHGRMKG